MTLTTSKPRVWIVDSVREPLADATGVLQRLAECEYYHHGEPRQGSIAPDAVVVSADIPGGAGGDAFAGLLVEAGGAPVLVASTLRSLTQALAFMRGGATDYLPLPIEAEEWRDRLAAALEKAETQAALSALLMEVEPVDGDPDVRFQLSGLRQLDGDDILASLAHTDAESEIPVAPADNPVPAHAAAETEEEPEAVDGVAIPSMWDELPCGLAAFDSNRNLVFCNKLALDLFGTGSLAELQDALDTRRGVFHALGHNGKPLPDNQWPHILAFKSRSARSGIISLERADKSRVWLRFDCLPHLSDQSISRLTMTLVNVTGEVSPPQPQRPPAIPAVPAAPARKPRGKRRR